MDAGLTTQYVLVLLAVAASVGYVIRRQFPAAVRRWRIRLAASLLRDGRTPWQQRLGRFIAPTPRAGVATSCGGCSGCEKGDPDR